MKGFFLFNLIALACPQVNGYPYGNLSPEFVWDTYRCSNINPIVDSKTIILIAKGAFPEDQYCHTIRRDLKVSDNTAYSMTVDFINISGEGHCGLVFNYWDDQNYDIVFKLIQQRYTRYGSVRNGVLSPLTNLKVPNPPVESGKWYNFKIEVSPKKEVRVYLDDELLGSFQAYFTTRGSGGALVANGFNNVAEFRNYDVSPILA